MENNLETKTDQTMRNFYSFMTRTFMAFGMLLTMGLFQNVQAQLACNDNVQISLESDCRVLVVPDMILEDPAVLDYRIVITNSTTGVVITDGDPDSDNSTMYVSEPGTYSVQIFNEANNNSCWGSIVVEDKLAPTLNCGTDITTSCDQDFAPGSAIMKKFVLEANVGAGGIIPAAGPPPGGPTVPTSAIFSFSLGSIDPGIVRDVNVILDIEHAKPGDLAATLTSPTAASTCLFNGAGTGFGSPCAGQDLVFSIDDDATNSHNDLVWTCRPTNPTIMGQFQSAGLSSGSCPAGLPAPTVSGLNGFNGQAAVAGWFLNIQDQSGTGGIVRSATLEILVEVGTIEYPTGFNRADIRNIDGNCFTLANQGSCGVEQICYTDQKTDLTCGQVPGMYAKIARTWTSTDFAGQSVSCTQNIYIENTDLSTRLQWPPNFDNLDMPAFACDDVIQLDDNNHPHPNVTGWPNNWYSLDAEVNIYGAETSGQTFCGNVQMKYVDLEIPICTGSYKVLRTWTVLDWCTGEIFNYDQLIKVEPRPLVLGNSFTDEEIFITDPWKCTVDYIVDLNDIGVIQTCGSITRTSVQYIGATDPLSDPCLEPTGSDVASEFILLPGGIEASGSSSGQYVLRDLPLGCTWVMILFETDCGLTTDLRFELTVVDMAPPTPVCEDNTVVALGTDGRAKIKAATFDDGSFDNCGGPLTYEVAKMSSTCGEFNGVFKSELTFCCADIGNTVMVAFRAIDDQGKVSQSCMVEVTVQNKIPPVLTCPPNITLDCDQDFENLGLTGHATATDLCGDVSLNHSDSGSLNQCGEGVITRTWTATGPNGRSVSCRQSITLRNSNPFDINDIIFPSDQTLQNECTPDLDPDSNPRVGNVRFNNESCSLVAATWEDLRFDFVDNACVKILRTWTVIDWCQYTGVGSSTGYYSKVQEIKLLNDEKPIFDGNTCASETIDGYGACGELYTATASATAACDGPVTYRYEIDGGSDGSIDFSGSSNTINRFLPFGRHTITWYATDGCGNTQTCNKNVTIVDDKAPTPYCLTVISTVVMPSNGMISIWAEDFNLNSEDNCTPQQDLRYSFSSNVNDQSRTFTCANILNGQSEFVQLEMWVTDAAGNNDFCNVLLQLQDNSSDGDDICADMSTGSGVTANISGLIRTENNETLKDAKIEISSNQPEYPLFFETDLSGQYNFPTLNTGYNYSLKTSMTDDPMNGVSTLDLVLIQKHILGLQNLSSPYKILAADVDNNNTVSASDLVYLRKLILGINTDFANGQEEWRFVPESFAFNNPAQPFPADEAILIDNLASNQSGMNFMAYKVGDVNTNAAINQFNVTEVRNREALTLMTEDLNFVRGDKVSVPVTAANFDEIIGMQFTLNFDKASMAYSAIEAGALNITEANVGAMIADRGMVTMSWNEFEAQTIDSDVVLFTITFDAIADGSIANNVSVSSDFTAAESYNATYETGDVELIYNENLGVTAVSNGFELFQNKPNPFNDVTVIGFNLPKSAKATLTVYDVTGKIIQTNKDQYSKGYNEVTLNKRELSGSNILYYTLESGNNTSTKRMVILD